jgi:citrate synthase
MLFKIGERHYQPNPVLERALDVLLSSTPTTSRTARPMRCARWGGHGSIRTRPSAGVGALYGSLHGGANEAVILCWRVGSVDKVPAAVKEFKQ